MNNNKHQRDETTEYKNITRHTSRVDFSAPTTTNTTSTKEFFFMSQFLFSCIKNNMPFHSWFLCMVVNVIFLSFLSFTNLYDEWKRICEVHTINFQTFFVWALLLIVHTWNSSPIRSNFPRLQCTCCTVPTTSGRSHGSPLVWACQWPSSQPLSSTQFSHNDSLRA